MNLMIFTALLAAALGAESSAPAAGKNFADGINHYQSGKDSKDYARYSPEQVTEIAANILLHQRSNGGWASNWDPLRILSDVEKDGLRVERGKLDTTFDNRATYPQIEYLADAYVATGDESLREAAIRGIEFMLEAQHACGGWPHSYPEAKNYRPFITFMDDVTAGTLSTIRRIALGDGSFAKFPEELRARALESMKRGEDALLKLQVVIDGKPTVWAGQYDPSTLQPTRARSFELPSLVSAESVNVVKYLMAIDRPTPEVIAAIEGAMDWYERAAIHGLEVKRVPIEAVRFDNHSATTDVVAIANPDAPVTWARFYEIDTMRPFMANRDGKKVYTLSEVHIERRTGYAWYTGAPASLEEPYKAWREKWRS